MKALTYLSGFGNQHESEALEGALPVGQNSPQRPPFGLYAEQLSGTSFTAPRAENRRTWLYRIRPSVRHLTKLRDVDGGLIRTSPCREATAPVGQLRWDPVPVDEAPATFLTGLRTIATNGDCHIQVGMAAHVYVATESMTDTYLADADGELLVVPELGGLRFHTECGVLEVTPGEICVVPRGMKFRVELLDGAARGYVAENYGSYLELPERGPIGANALANPRDFLYPTAAYDASDAPCELYLKFDGRMLATTLDHSPLDVVAWHGNHAPYKYDLSRFCPIGSIGFDHPDPSIFTVLTSSSDRPGTANLDFVLIGDRWLVAEHSFRPPWFHQNVMSELMGLIRGVYDAKPQGFVPGGMSLHNALLPHGPSSDAWEAASNADLAPQKLADTMAFMFESRYPFILTEYAAGLPQLQHDYTACWSALGPKFQP